MHRGARTWRRRVGSVLHASLRGGRRGASDPGRDPLGAVEADGTEPGETVLCVNNLSSRPQAATVQLPEHLGERQLIDLFGGSGFPWVAADGRVTIGGPTLAADALRAGLVDEVTAWVVPHVAGGGLRLLPDGFSTRLRLREERRWPGGVVELAYDVVRAGDGPAR